MKPIKQKLLELIQSTPSDIQVRISNPVWDENGCEYGILAKSTFDGRPVLLDLHNSPDINPREYPVGQLPPSVLLDILRDCVTAEGETLLGDYDACAERGRLTEWAEDAISQLARSRKAFRHSRKETACRFIHEVMGAATGPVRLDIYKDDITLPYPYTITVDHFLGLEPETIRDFNTIERVRTDGNGLVLRIVWKVNADALEPKGQTLRLTERNLEPFWSDPDNDMGLTLPDESIYYLEGWLNALQNKESNKKHQNVQR